VTRWPRKLKVRSVFGLTLDIIAPAAASWGIKVNDILLKDLRFSQELQESLSSAAKQKRIGESKIIIAQAEVESAKLMREASDILNTPAAMQIRYLETLQNMAKTANSKVIFMPGESGQSKGGTSGNNAANLDVSKTKSVSRSRSNLDVSKTKSVSRSGSPSNPSNRR
jgi:regulator of protease activity HflC (stomatin/prohibitin superfamily)